jgi:hypothetical protein
VGLVKLAGGTGRPGNTYHAHILGPNDKEGTDFQMVPITTLDALVADKGITKLDFIKCDVEGAEILVFKGGKHVLKTHRPIVMCEVSQRGMSYYNLLTDDVFTFFGELGYQSFAWREAKLIPVKRRISEAFNYVFLPQEQASDILNSVNC